MRPFKLYVNPKHTQFLRHFILLVLAFIIGQFTRVSYWVIIGITMQAQHTDLAFYLNKHLKSNLLASLVMPLLVLPLHLLGGPYNLQDIFLGMLILLALESVVNKRSYGNFVHACVLSLSSAPEFPNWQEVVYVYPARAAQRLIWILVGALSAYLVNLTIVSANQGLVLANYLKYLQSLVLDLVDRIYEDPINLATHEHTMLTLTRSRDLFLQMLIAIRPELSKAKYDNIKIYLDSIEQVLNFYYILVNLDLQISHKQAVKYFYRKLEILKDILLRQYARIDETPGNLLR